MAEATRQEAIIETIVVKPEAIILALTQDEANHLRTILSCGVSWRSYGPHAKQHQPFGDVAHDIAIALGPHTTKTIPTAWSEMLE